MTQSETPVPACTEKNDKMWKKDEKNVPVKVYDCGAELEVVVCAVAGLF